MTVGQHISNMRALIKQYSRTQENYTDQFLYNLLIGSRAELIRNQARQFNKISEWNWQSYCMALKKTRATKCDCVPSDVLDCTVLRTVDKIPQALKNRNKSLVNFSTPGDNNIILMSEKERIAAKFDEIKSQQLSGSIINGYFYIWNYPNNSLKYVVANGIWEDPTIWQEITDCTTGDSCFDIYTSDLGLDTDMQNTAYRMVLDILKIPLSLTSDLTNDSDGEIKT